MTMTSLKTATLRACIGALASVCLFCVAALVPAPALALSEGRVYELVSPLFKGGYGAIFQAASPDGENVAFSSLGVFAGIPLPAVGSTYLAHREAGKGWTTTPLQPPFSEAGIADFSSNLEYVLAGHPFTLSEGEMIRHRIGTPDTPANWESWGGIQTSLGSGEEDFLESYERTASNDLCHVLLIGKDLTSEAIGVENSGAEHLHLYDMSAGCHGEGASVQLLGVRNRLGPHGEPELINRQCHVFDGLDTSEGSGSEESGLFSGAMSADGSEIFFGTAVDPGAGCTDPQVFVRLGGSRTVEVSRPADPSLPFGGCGEGGNVGEVPGEVPCVGAAGRAPAFFQGASEDGSRVYFKTSQRLVEGVTDPSVKLYLASIGCPPEQPACEPGQRRVTGLVDASQSNLVGEAAEVQGVVSMGRDARRMYFVARGVLTTVPDSEGVSAVKGADNLYVYDAQTGAVGFIADLCSAARTSGIAEDARCPSGLATGVNDTSLWTGHAGDASQATPDGRYLVFSTYGRLIGHGAQVDVDGSRDVYRYDAQTGVLDRVSLGEDGADANGNGNGFDASIEPVYRGQGTVAQQQSLETRAISDDGSRIVFSSTEPLSEAAINHHKNVYVWHKEPGWSEGRVAMISSGTSLTDDIFPMISADGINVFFSTSQGLVPGDTENDLDVYDARVGGGFPGGEATRMQCSSDACQGALTNPAPLLVPGSAAQAAGGNFTAPILASGVGKARQKAKTKKVKHRAKPKCKAKRRTASGAHCARGAVFSSGSRAVALGRGRRGR